MLASELIDPSILPLHPDQTAEEAIESLQEQALLHGVVLDGEHVIGIVSENWLLDANPSDTLKQLTAGFPESPILKINQSELEAMRVMSEQQIDVLPLVDEDNICVGIISLRRTFIRLGRKIAPPVAGGILVLRVHPLNYQLSQIAQIVESGDALVHAMYVENLSDDQNMLVTLFTNKEDLDGIVQTFRRYEYDVVGTFYQSVDEVRLKERYDGLMRYLNT
jgi:CBS-domain-containing membrane protein